MIAQEGCPGSMELRYTWLVMKLVPTFATAFVTAVLSAFAGPVAAAPQILGVIASDGPQSLVCDDADCSLYLSAFCIQQERAPPTPGTRYHPAPSPAEMMLIVTTAEGKSRRVPAARHVQFTSLGGYTAVRVSLSRAALVRLGGSTVALEVGPGVSLVPKPTLGDPDPLTEQEISLATGPWRTAATAIFETAGATPEADGARLLAAVINALPERARADGEARAGVWARVAGAGALAGLTATGIERARLATGICRSFTRGRTQEPLRRCLERQHDAWLMDLNQDYWDSLVAW